MNTPEHARAVPVATADIQTPKVDIAPYTAYGLETARNIRHYGTPVAETYEISNGASAYSTRERLKNMFLAGQMPGVANGYQFVFDHRPTGQTDAEIPATEYTAYFSRRCIPVAAPGHRMFGHDAEHAEDYIDMLAHEPVADFVQLSAQQGAPTLEGCKQFAGGLDTVSDARRNLASNMRVRGSVTIGDINAARLGLTKLMDLYARGLPVGSDTWPLFDRLWQALNMPYYQQQPRHYDAIPYLPTSERPSKHTVVY